MTKTAIEWLDKRAKAPYEFKEQSIRTVKFSDALEAIEEARQEGMKDEFINHYYRTALIEETKKFTVNEICDFIMAKSYIPEPDKENIIKLIKKEFAESQEKVKE